MLKKAASYIFIIVGLALLWASTSRTAMRYIAEHRDNDKWWGSYQGLRGDLVSMSYLDIVKRFSTPQKSEFLNKPVYHIPKKTVLYLDGDSYARHLGDTDFAGVQTYIPIDRNHGINYHLDSSKRNILIIEVSERYLRPYFSGLQMLDEVCDSVVKRKSITYNGNELSAGCNIAGFIPGFYINSLFNKYINQNLQCNLFNYNFIMPVFESKAALNYYIFNRASGDVVISKDKDFLFLKETVTKTDAGSSYSPVTDEDVQRLVGSLNTIYDHYKRSGFAEVYFSPIPNTATIMQPEGYNNLIPRVQSSPALRMKIIDIYTFFKSHPDVYYLTGDTHWNSKGRQAWLNLVNEQLANQAAL